MRFALLAITLQIAFATRAHADERERVLARAVELSLDAEFEQALSLFAQLTEAGQLARAQLALLLEERALVWFALQRDAELARDLAQLAEIEPTARLPDRAPPSLVARWEEMRTRVAARAHESRPAHPGASATRKGVNEPLAAAFAGERSRDDARARVRLRRGLWIGGAALAVVAASTALILVPHARRAGSARSSVAPMVEF
jgi:hypothetical protein